jgi:molybdopterin synthase sulfur carrier subunit
MTPNEIQVQVRYFASLREALGSAETLSVPAGTTLGALREALRGRSPRHAEVLSPARPVRCALNQRMSEDSVALTADAEVAFFPPVTGG